MSWKLFWQIALLIVIAAVVMTTLKVGLVRCKYGRKGKYLKSHSQSTYPYKGEHQHPHGGVRK